MVEETVKDTSTPQETTATPIQESNSSDKKSSKTIWIVIGFIMVLLVGIGIIYAINNQSSSESGNNIIINAPTKEIAPEPTPKPTQTSTPIESPEETKTPKPTKTPSSTEEPTPKPTS